MKLVKHNHYIIFKERPKPLEKIKVEEIRLRALIGDSSISVNKKIED